MTLSPLTLVREIAKHEKNLGRLMSAEEKQHLQAYLEDMGETNVRKSTSESQEGDGEAAEGP